jgi:hypothetical protein
LRGGGAEKIRDEGGGMRDESENTHLIEDFFFFILHPSALIPCFASAAVSLVS